MIKAKMLRIVLLVLLFGVLGVWLFGGGEGQGQECRPSCPPPPEKKPPPGFLSILVIVNVADVPTCDTKKQPNPGAKVTLKSKKAGPKASKEDLTLLEGVTNAFGQFAAWIFLFGVNVEAAVADMEVTIEKPGFKVTQMFTVTLTIPFLGTSIIVSACKEPTEPTTISVPQRTTGIQEPEQGGSCASDTCHAGGISQICTACPEGVSAAPQDTGGRTIYLHNGEFFHYTVDLEIPGRGFNWKFERKYRSGIIFDGPLGRSWEFNYNRRLVEVNSANLALVQKALPLAQIKAGDVVRMDGYGRADLYARNPDGSFGAPTGFYTQLIKNPDGTFTERDRMGNRVIYARPDIQGLAPMTQLSDRNSNTMRFQYNDRGQLTRVLDTLGRSIDYVYSTEGRLIEVRDFFNRSIKFRYDANGDLIEVTSPAVTGTPNGNDFRDGKTTRYTYSSGFADERLNHNLLTITAPNEVATGGPPRVVITYDTNLSSPNVDRVLSQTVGGTNRTGLPAGGTIRYEYRALAAPRPNDFVSPVSQTTVTDRNGNITEYQFNQLGNIVRIREFTNRDIRPGDPEFFETRYEYNQDGELIRMIYPEGNSVEYVYDDQNPDRFQQGNVLSETQRPDAKRSGDQAFIKTTYTYEPIYNQIRAITEARGNDPSYVPQNGGTNSPERYTTAYTFDYQEGTNFAALAQKLGVSEAQVRQLLQQAGISMGLGDVNKDGRTDQINGNVIRIEYPTVQLLPACTSDEITEQNTNCSLQARLEGTSRQPIVELYQYNQFGQMTKRIDPEGNVDVYDYYPENDPDGDGRDLTQGVSSGPFGYLKQEIRDAESSPIRNSRTNPKPTQIRRQYLYDRVGNVIKEIDGRGIATEYSVNQLNQVVEIRRAADVSEALKNPEEPKWGNCTDQTLIECKAGMVAFNYRTWIFYDHNDNVIKREIENKDSNNQSLAGTFVEYTSAYDILDNMIEETQEVSENPREILVTKYRYDRNENRVLEISPVANLPAGHPERQPSNVVSYVFDERDLLFTSTRGGLTEQFKALPANADIPELRQIPNSPDISTFTRIYDLNKNLKEFIDGADNTGDGKPESTLYLYDGFDRQVSVVDAIGNQSFTQYDPASNVIRVSNFGPVGGKSPTSNAAANFKQPLLSQVENKYDELNRNFERNDKLFVYQGVEYKRKPVLQDGPLGASNDGIVTTRYEYDRNSRRTFLIEDDLSVFATRYDGVDRVLRKIDPELNEVLYTYDDNNNAVKVVEVEITQRDDVKAGKVPDLRETFTTINVYDSLGRLIRTTDNLGQTNRNHYDSRNNLIFTSDAQHSKELADLIADPLGLFPATGQDSRGVTRINKPGNTMEYFYDGINRKLAEVRHLRVDGQGKNPIDTSNPANPDGLIVIDFDWDANSRLVAMADDGSVQGDQNTSIGVIEPTNPKGNVTRYIYDDLNRQAREIFDDNTCNVYSYDADDNLRRMVDENGSAIVNSYDGINRLTRKDITRATSATPHPAGCFKDSSITWQVIGTTLQELEYDGLSRMTRSFDNNEPDDAQDDATVTYAYDSLSRLLEEVQNGFAVSSRWMGDVNRVGLVYPNGRELEYTFDKLDRINTISNKGAAKNIVDYDYLGPGRVLERTYGNGVRLTHLDDARQKDVGYDGLKRIVLYRHLRQDNSLVAGFAYDYDRANNKLFEIKQHDNNRREDYTYDSLYRLVRFARQGEPEDTWQLDGVGNWAKRKDMPNQPNNLNEYTAFAGVPQLHDDNGNLIEDGTNRYQYDFANRLRRVTRKSDSAAIGIYCYDAHGRRTERIVTNTLSMNERARYLYDGWKELEEERSNVIQWYVYGIMVDELLTLERDFSNDGTIDQVFLYHQDSKTYVVALTDLVKGSVIERVTYDPYGTPTIKDAVGRSLEVSGVGNPYLYTGRRFDPETGLYYYRARYLHPIIGRFIQRDPLRWGDGPNLYQYVRSNPINLRDPKGRESWSADFQLWEEDDGLFTGGDDPVVFYHFKVTFTCKNRQIEKGLAVASSQPKEGSSLGESIEVKEVNDSCIRVALAGSAIHKSGWGAGTGAAVGGGIGAVIGGITGFILGIPTGPGATLTGFGGAVAGGGAGAAIGAAVLGAIGEISATEDKAAFWMGPWEICCCCIGDKESWLVSKVDKAFLGRFMATDDEYYLKSFITVKPTCPAKIGTYFDWKKADPKAGAAGVKLE